MTEIAIDVEFIIGVIASLIVIIGVLIIAVVHIYTQMIKNYIKTLSERTDKIEINAKDAHIRISHHVQEYHT